MDEELTVYEVRRRFKQDLGMGLSVYDSGEWAGVHWVTARPADGLDGYGLNGYVMIPPTGHPWSTAFPKANIKRFDEQPLQQQLDVHGGITLARHPWLGFDTMHPGDIWSYRYDEMGVSRRYDRGVPSREWSPSTVEREAKKLAGQVAIIGQKYRQRADAVKWASRVGLSRFQHLDVTE